MLLEVEKLHIIEKLLQVTDSFTLKKLDYVLSSAGKLQEGVKSFKDFAGLMTDEEADEFMKAINDGCGQIDEDGW